MRGVELNRTVLGATLLALFFFLAVLAATVDPLPADRAISNFITERRTPPLTAAIVGVNFLGSFYGIGVGLLAVTIWGWRNDRRLAWVIVFSTLVLAWAVEVLKFLVSKPRPENALFVGVNYAFPSSHMAVSVYFFGWLWLLAGRGKPTWRRRVARVGLPLVVLMIGFGRVYVGAHWPSDVLGGLLLGLGALVIVSDRAIRD